VLYFEQVELFWDLTTDFWAVFAKYFCKLLFCKGIKLGGMRRAILMTGT
jgi:hypothetical protein